MTTTSHLGPRCSEIFPGHRRFVSVPVQFRNLPDACMTLVPIVAIQELDKERDNLCHFLSSQELQYLQRFRFAKRRHEWLAGRIAAKAVAMIHCDSGQRSFAPERITILSDVHGRPDPDQGWPVGLCRPTISHSHEYGVAMVSSVRCGVDLQQLEDRLIGLADRIMEIDEARVMRELFRQEQLLGLTLIWSVKEAVKKMHLFDQPGLFDAIRIEEIDMTGPDQWQVLCRLVDSGRQQVVDAAFFEQYVLAWCQEEEGN